MTFTTPNKWFPIEPNTFILVLYWLPDHTYRRILKRVGRDYFAGVANLNLLNVNDFQDSFPPSRYNRMLRIGICLTATSPICSSSKNAASVKLRKLRARV